MALLTNLDIVNAACARIGADPLQDLEEETFGGQQASLIYEETIDFNLGIYLFSWSTQIRQLSKVSNATPLTGWANVFDLPAERMGSPLYLTDDITDPDRRFARYTLVENRAHSDADPLFAAIRFRPNPPQWSVTFRAATITALASKFALSMASDRQLRDTLHTEAYGTPTESFRGGQIGTAIRDDARATPPRTPNWQNNPLTRAWRSGASSGAYGALGREDF